MSVQLASALRFVVVSSLPSGAQGDAVVLAANGHLYVYDGTGWVDHGAAGGGGGGAVSSATITLPSGMGVLEHYQTITNGAVSGSSRINIWLAATTADDENEIDTIDLVAISAIPGTGTFDIVVTFSQPMSGVINLNYMVT